MRHFLTLALNRTRRRVHGRVAIGKGDMWRVSAWAIEPGATPWKWEWFANESELHAPAPSPLPHHMLRPRPSALYAYPDTTHNGHCVKSQVLDYASKRASFEPIPARERALCAVGEPGARNLLTVGWFSPVSTGVPLHSALRPNRLNSEASGGPFSTPFSRLKCALSAPSSHRGPGGELNYAAYQAHRPGVRKIFLFAGYNFPKSRLLRSNRTGNSA